MPELPEVETVARGVAGKITGKTISKVHLKRREILHGNGGPLTRLVGRVVSDVRRCGKQVRILLRDPSGAEQAMYVHLGMTGKLVAVDRKLPVEKHTHLRVEFADSPLELRFCDPRRFGGIWLLKNGVVDPAGCKSWRGRRLPPIGADPLEISLPEWRAMLNRNRQIKALLLDQQPISGMGNIYCDEALHRAGIHPLTVAADLEPEAVRRLYQAVRRVLNEAIRAGGSSVSDYRMADNTLGSFQVRHRVYGREGQPCRTCGCPIERFMAAGRGTHICPHCQPRRRSCW